MINGKTNKIGILGWPVEHSQSPLIQNSAFAAAGLNYIYLPLPVSPDHLKDAVAGLKALGFAGANVTIPHKVSVIPFLDEIDESARSMGAVNTLVIRNKICTGYNTDAEGFIQSLLVKGIEVKGKRAIVLGAGGAARAVVHGLLQHKTANIVLVARDQEKAARFLNLFAKPAAVTFCPWEAGREFADRLAACDILIHCTSQGMSPKIEGQPFVDWDAINKKIVVCDLVYNPLYTSFLKKAAGLGHTIVTGDGMLVEQGALAFSLWTSCQAPRNTMYRVFRESFAR
ncbi:Shikimate dehydrogenase [Propionispora sp. 2/2-37]|uniref:shikimate dehydrogenase n=1 Tax=Propionispora sp. 2/2-37 TaxID=1677858 RepID=UPI0006BB568B|nr:shikimate dehydrogenase [Propionispora sp. 2/2-37]CUH94081.1 Shikimate dehydrogenase [Propionispora sp. 2/2-37]